MSRKRNLNDTEDFVGKLTEFLGDIASFFNIRQAERRRNEILGKKQIKIFDKNMMNEIYKTTLLPMEMASLIYQYSEGCDFLNCSTGRELDIRERRVWCNGDVIGVRDVLNVNSGLYEDTKVCEFHDNHILNLLLSCVICTISFPDLTVICHGCNGTVCEKDYDMCTACKYTKTPDSRLPLSEYCKRCLVNVHSILSVDSGYMCLNCFYDYAIQTDDFSAFRVYRI